MEPTKISFNKTAFISSLKNHLQQLESETEAKLKSLMKEEAESKVSEMDNVSVKFKDIVNITPKDGTTFPDEIYSAVLKRVVTVEAPKLSGGTWGEGAIIKQLGEYIAELLDNNTEAITVDGTTYMLSNDFGSTISLVNVTIKGKNAKYKFIWDDTNDTTRKSLDDYMKSLLVLEKERLLNVFIALLKDADKAGIIDTAKDTAKDLLSKWVRTLMNGKKLKSLSNLTDFEFLRQLSSSNIKQTDNLVTSAIKEVNKEINDILEDIKDVVNPSRKLKALLMVVDTLDEFVAWTKEAFDDSKNKIDDITKKYNKFLEETVQLADYFVSNEDVEISSESIAKSKTYKNFIKAFNNLETTIGESETSFDSILSEYNIYEFTDVTDAVIYENNAIINDTDNADTIKSTGTNVTINGNGENDSITTTNSKALVNGGKGNDTILSDGFNSKIYGNEGDDIIYVEGKQTSVDGGSGSDTIVVNNSDVTVNGGGNFDGLPVIDTIIISSDSEDVVINDFDKDDILNLSAYNANDLSAGIYQTTSLEIWSRKTHKTIVILSDVTSGTNENILCKDDNGEVIQVSLNWILENTPPIINPYDTLNSYDNLKPSQVVTVPINENIDNSLNNVMITALSGDHSIENSGNAVTINGGSNKDTIKNAGNSTIIDARAGNDSIINSEYSLLHYTQGGVSVLMQGGDGEDTISNIVSSNVTLEGGNDNDSLSNGFYRNSSYTSVAQGGDSVLIKGDDGKDTLTNESGSYTTLDGGAGDDNIRSQNGHNVKILGGSGSDRIYNQTNNGIIDSGTDNDTITNSGDNTEINSETGNNLISNIGSSVLILTGDGNNTIGNVGSSDRGSNVTINSGMGDDSISNSGDNVSINSSGGNDTIRNSKGSSVSITGGIGNDSIYNNNSKSVFINSGDGNDSIENNYYSDNISIVSGSGDDYIYNGQNNNASIDSGNGNDNIHNKGNASTIVGGTGNDSILNSGKDLTINGNAGDDTIMNYSYADNITINAGEGNDLISLNSFMGHNLIEYSSGDGNDIVYGFNRYSTLVISGNSYNSIVSDLDVIINVGNGSINLKYLKQDQAPIMNIIGNYNPNTTPTDTTPADTTPADTTPADTTPADTTPADTTPADTTPADTTPTDTTPADTTPADTTPADTTPADTTPADTTSSGQDQSSTVQIVKDITGLNIDRLDSIVLTDSSSIEEAISDGTKLLNISSDSGVMNVDLRDSNYRQIVSLEGGNQKVQFNDQNGNIAIVGDNSTGWKNIIFGNGTDVGVFTSPKATTQVSVGSGRDSIITDNNARVRVDMTNSDETKIIPYSGRIILDNYNPDSRAEIVIQDITDITDAIKDNSIQLVGNEIRSNSSTRIKLNDSDDSNIVNLATKNNDTQKVGFTGINGGAVDASTLRGNLLLKGNYAENASDKQKRKPSTLISGNGHDTILAGARDFVDGGNGRNQIFLTPYDLRQIRDGATIASSGNGRNTIHGFHEGFGYDGDVIQVKDFNNLKFKFDTDGLLLTANDSRIKFDGIGIASATTDDSTNSLGTDRAELIQITNGSSTMRTAVAQTNQSILVQEDDYIIPNAFFGNRSGLNFSEYRGSVEINLADGTGKLGKWDATFKGINKLQAGNGMSTLIGDDTRNTLIAGTGYTSMWGGSGNDKLIGKGNSTDKNGRTTFFFFAGDGRDVISDFTFLTPENRYDGIDDRINVGNSDINDAYRAGNNVVVVFDQNSYLILEDAVGKDFQIANMIAKVDRNIAYDGLANCYVASGGSSLTVDSTVRSAEIWLDNSHGTQFFGNIRTLDASAVEGNTSLVGNEFDDTIIAGQGDSSLWGGFASSNDLLIGGNSRNTFFYCMGNGNDTIQGTNDRDFVILSDVSLDQITETSITDDSVSIRFNDGGSLQIKGTSDVTYQLADGSKYSANHQRLEWDSR